MKPILGYCTNVHAGADWATTRANLARYATEVRRHFAPSSEMGIGLWLSASAAAALGDAAELSRFSAWLAESGLRPFTLNGFPYGDFHQDVVKHRVYEPNWFDRRRVEYTKQLATLLARLLPDAQGGSISTLPICWGSPAPGRAQRELAAAHLREVAAYLRQLYDQSGHEIVLAVEPEPGCAIQRLSDVLRFFRDFLWSGKDTPGHVRRHIGVCHDICHSVVMFEEQARVLRTYHEAGIRVGKVQVSSAVCVDFAQLDAGQRRQAVAQLHGFDERRYLHQTTVRERDGSERFHEDLSLPLAAVTDPTMLDSAWHIHFHVPVSIHRFGQLSASQAAIHEALAALRRYHAEVTDYEVETYAWGVLPDELQQPDLARGIAAELHWCTAAMHVENAKQTT